MGNEPTIPARQQATAEPAAVHGRADTHDFAGADDAEIRLMQDGVRDWVQHTVRRGKDGLRTASPAILLSALCASAFCPLLMVGGVAGAGLAVLSSVGGGFLTQVLTDALSRLRERIAGQAPSPEDVQKGIAEQIERVLAAGDEHSASVRNDIASALKEIDAGGTALRAAMEQSNELVRSDVINAIGVLCSDFGELGFLIKDVGQAAADIQRSLDVQGADVQATRGGLMVVTGASGAGKSSLLRAGLLPILARGQQVQGSDQWPRIVMTPTKDPLTELAARLAAVGGNDTVTVRDGLARRADRAHLTIWSTVLAAVARRNEAPPASSDSTARLVLIVDQFEQVFTLNPDPGGEAGRQAFITALRTAATSPVGPQLQPPALVVIAVRGDFWDRCAAYPELAGAMQDGQFVVGPMSESELRVAITGPADAAGLRVDPALTDTILSDLRALGGDGSAGALPLLSQAMALTWEIREGDRLTSHGYGQTGGVSRAVQTGADKVYHSLAAAQQALARDVLRSMTVASRDGRLARRPVTRAELYAGLSGAERAQIDAVLEAFAAERLIVLNEDTAEISHDILLQAWPRLRTWLEEDQASWILYGQLADDAVAGRDNGDDSSFLYRGTQLTAVRQATSTWAANPARYPALTATQSDFLLAGERALARGTRQRRTVISALVVLLAAALTGAGLASVAATNANDQHNRAVSAQLATESETLDTGNPITAAATGMG